MRLTTNSSSALTDSGLSKDAADVAESNVQLSWHVQLEIVSRRAKACADVLKTTASTENIQLMLSLLTPWWSSKTFDVSAPYG